MIYLITGSGEPNYGDDLIAYLWICYYRESGYLGPIIVDCKSVEGSLSLHTSLDDNVFFAKHIKSLTIGRKGNVFYYLEKGRDFARNKFNKLDAINVKGNKVTINLKDSRPRFIHLIGGGYINGAWPNSFAIFGALEVLHDERNIPCFATGLGISPLNKVTNDELLVIANIIKRIFVFFEVRDIESYLELSTVNGYIASLINGYDDTFLYSIDSLVDCGDSCSRLHLSGFKKSFDSVDLKGLIEHIQSEIEIEEILFWGCNHNDLLLYEEINRYFPNIVYKDNYDLIYNKIKISESDIMVTSRFHPHLIAFRAGASGVYIAHSGFYNNKHKSIQVLGSNFSNLKVITDFEVILKALYSEKTLSSESQLFEYKRVLASKICQFI